MRNYQTLTHAALDSATGLFHLTDSDDEALPRLALRREGDYLLISASSGAFEIALRLKYAELLRALTHLHAIDGLSAPRQVGSAQAYLGIGLRTDGTLILRPTLVADATGLFCLNYMISDAARRELFAWLGV